MKRKVLATLLAITLTAGCMTPLSATAEEQVTEIEENSMIQNNGAGNIVQSGSCGENASYTLDEDGSVNVPEALRPYMGGKEKLVPKH